jgi:hypothetical protein
MSRFLERLELAADHSTLVLLLAAFPTAVGAILTLGL